MKVHAYFEHLEKYHLDPSCQEDRLTCERVAVVQGWKICTCNKFFARVHNLACPSCRKTNLAAENVRRGVDEEAPHPIPPGVFTATPAQSRSLPSVQEVFQKKVNTKSFVPAESRQAVLDIIVSALNACMDNNEEADWIRMMMSVKTLMSPLVRGGKRTQGSFAKALAARTAAWNLGEQRALWEAIPAPAPSSNSYTAEVHKQKGCIALTRDGHYARALQRLLSEGVQSETPEITDILRRLHPEGSGVEMEVGSGGGEIGGLDGMITAEMVSEVMAGFDDMTACGALGFKVPFLKCLFAVDYSGTLLSAFRRFIVYCAKGKAHESVRTFLSGACLTALKKAPKVQGDKPGTRPVAAGEILRRFAAKCLMKGVKPQCDATFLPLQFGVGAKCGAEQMYHRILLACLLNKDNPDYVTVKVDMSNAFNNVERAEFEKMIKVYGYECILEYVRYTYGRKAHLWFGEQIILSQQGVQQGDPLGPLLFAFVLLPVIVHLQEFGLTINVWFLDDGVLSGTHEAVAAALAFLGSDQVKASGLFLNKSKCEIIWLKPEFESAGFLPDFPHRILDGNFVILGSPIGSEEYVFSHIDAIRMQLVPAWSALSRMEDLQVAVTLLRACCHYNKINHLMRTVPPNLAARAFEVFDEDLKRAFSNISALNPTHTAFQQCSMATKWGGLGLRSARRHSMAAYVSSVAYCASKEPGVVAADHPDFTRCHAVLVEELGVARVEECLASPKPQKELCASLDEKTAGFLQRTAPDEMQLGRLMALRQPGASAWLDVRPSGDNILTSPEFLVCLRLRLGMDVYAETDRDRVCPVCATTVLDRKGQHALNCLSGGTHMARHHACRDVLFTAAQRASLHPWREPNLSGSKGERPADFTTLEGGTTYANDVFVINPLRDGLLEHHLVRPGSATSVYADREKNPTYVPICVREGMVFRAIGADVYGVWDENAKNLIAKISKGDAAKHDCRPEEVQSRLTSRLSVIVMRHNARAVIRRDNQSELHPILDAAWSTTAVASQIKSSRLVRGASAVWTPPFGTHVPPVPVMRPRLTTTGPSASTVSFPPSSSISALSLTQAESVSTLATARCPPSNPSTIALEQRAPVSMMSTKPVPALFPNQAGSVSQSSSSSPSPSSAIAPSLSCGSSSFPASSPSISAPSSSNEAGLVPNDVGQVGISPPLPDGQVWDFSSQSPSMSVVLTTTSAASSPVHCAQLSRGPSPDAAAPHPHPPDAVIVSSTESSVTCHSPPRKELRAESIAVVPPAPEARPHTSRLPRQDRPHVQSVTPRKAPVQPLMTDFLSKKKK